MWSVAIISLFQIDVFIEMAKIVVLGGNGFIGSEVCRIAVNEGHEVVGLSRSGRPEELSEDWLDEVDWVQASVLEPETWREHLQGADAVIHCIGILREKPDQGITFERINGDSVEIAAWEAEQAGVERFVFISAKDNPPFLSSRYLAAKRQGETALHRMQLREIILRPMFIDGPRRPSSLAVGSVLRAASKLPLVGDAVEDSRPLRVEQVATTAVRAATELDYEGVVSLDNIEFVAQDDWQAYRRDRMPSRKVNGLLLGGAVAGLIAGAAWGLSRSRS